MAGQLAEEDELRDLVHDLRDEIARHRLTFFETATALAFHLFERRNVQVAVLEVGLGGRLDATNVVTPLLAAITNVAKDHSEYLGESLSEIAREKAGIIKPGVPLITTERDAGLLAIFREVCTRMGAPFVPIPVDDDAMDLEIADDHTDYTVSTSAWGSLRIRSPLVGGHQAVNGALALAILERLPEHFRPDAPAVVEGIRDVRWPGRAQVVPLDGATWLFDVAHNPAGALALASVVDCLALARPRVLLAAVLADKDWCRMLTPLIERMDSVVLTEAPSVPPERRWDPRAVAATLGDVGVEVEADLLQALRRARELAGEGSVVVTGSNHTVGDALALLDLPVL